MIFVMGLRRRALVARSQSGPAVGETVSNNNPIAGEASRPPASSHHISIAAPAHKPLRFYGRGMARPLILRRRVIPARAVLRARRMGYPGGSRACAFRAIPPVRFRI
jgi:hypothetical protein